MKWAPPHIQSRDWTNTFLGDIKHWPQSLRTALSICLNSPVAACVTWGPVRASLYNERYQTLCGAAHPHTLGHDFAECWQDVWPAIRTAFERALNGESAFIENQRVLLNSDAAQREALLSFSFAPIRAENDEIGGVFVSILDAAPWAELKRVGEDRAVLNYVISHDLRSPLRSMEGLTRMMLEDPSPLPVEEMRLLLGRIVRSTGKVGDRVDGLLSFMRVSHQPLTRQRIDIQTLVAEILVEQRARKDAPDVEIRVAELPEVMGDPELVRQVFVNTLSNAFKFIQHTEHPRIEIGASRLENQTAYFVSDNGAGFDMKYAAKLFSLFHRLHSETEFEGAGVSLALARRIIERHGGSIWAEAKKGHGATFRFTLPR